VTTTHTTHRKRIALGARLAIVAGAILALAGSSLGTAQAQEAPGENTVTLCHRTNNVDGPYQSITVSFNGGDGTLQGPDHTGHGGPAFDFAADPDVAYPTPRNGDQWGDIIPPYEWDGGSYPGMNWDAAGEAVYAGPDGVAEDDPQTDGDESADNCQGEAEPVDLTCPAGTTWVDAGDLNGEVEEAECQAPLVVTCPVGQTHVDANTNGAVDAGECQTAQVISTVVESTPAAPVTEVLGVQVAAAELPRTGKASLPLAELGLGLLLMGAGALVFARDEAATA
jgi:hypothetical protein